MLEIISLSRDRLLKVHNVVNRHSGSRRLPELIVRQCVLFDRWKQKKAPVSKARKQGTAHHDAKTIS